MNVYVYNMYLNIKRIEILEGPIPINLFKKVHKETCHRIKVDLCSFIRFLKKVRTKKF